MADGFTMMAINRKQGELIGYALTIFSGAFLMFLIQPLMGKLITPQFGGVAAVWSACLLFFQMALLAGYGLSYGIARLPAKTQAISYGCLFALSVFLFAIPNNWAPQEGHSPILQLLWMMTRTLALPCMLLSSISVMIQNWTRLSGVENPYPLYSVSNIGSLGALLLYPFVIEPSLTLGSTLSLWTWGYRLVVLLVMGCAAWIYSLARKQALHETAATESDPPPPWQQWLLWIGLSAAGTYVLVSFTNYLCNFIASIPLIWLLPLTLYLLSFILCFSKYRFYRPIPFIVVFLALFVYVNYQFKSAIGPETHFSSSVSFLLLMFTMCMLCHGELVRNKPPSRYLSGFYLAIAFGGMLGSVFVNLIAPLIFNSFIEDWHLIMTLMLLLSAVLLLKPYVTRFGKPVYSRAFAAAILLYCGYYVYHITDLAREDHKTLLFSQRNFYGVVQERREYYQVLDATLPFNVLSNGHVVHGMQTVTKKKDFMAFRYVPCTYYSKLSSVNLFDRLLREHKANHPLRYGVVGLGVGTIATYGKPGDTMAFYEIDPKVIRIALQYFTYLSDSKAKVRVVAGDGRLSLQKQAPQQFDILVIDAFSSHAIPVHLLTLNAMQLYLSHTNPDGVILFHITNPNLDLAPVIGNVAHKLGLKASVIGFYPSPAYPKFINRNFYVAVYRNNWIESKLNNATALHEKYPYTTMMAWRKLDWDPKIGLWTDDFSNIWAALKMKRPPGKKHD